MLDEDAILRIREYCYCSGGNWVTKITPKKSNWRFRFFQPRFVTPFSPIASSGSWNSRYCFFIQHFWEYTHHNRRTLEFMILHLRQTVLRILNSQNYWLLGGEGGGGIGWWKSGLKKSKNIGSIFSVSIFFIQPPTHSPSFPIAISAGPSKGDKNRAEKIENCWFDFFRYDFNHIPLQSGQDPWIRDIESSSNTFGNLLSAMSNSRSPDYDGRGRGTKW